MKKILITISVVCTLLITGCYKEDTATVRINLSNMPVAQNVQQKTFLDKVRSFFVKDAYAAGYPIYIAALKDNQPLEVISTNTGELSNQTVEMELPAENSITIVVLYHWISTGNIYYYGYATVDLKAGKETDVVINAITNLNSTSGLNFSYSSNICTWNPIPGATKYILEADTGNGNWIVLYEDLDNEKSVPYYGSGYGLKVYFEYFSIETNRYVIVP